jgi:hypothetical protein
MLLPGKGWIAGIMMDKSKEDESDHLRETYKPRVYQLLTEGIAVNSKAYFNILPGKPHVSTMTIVERTSTSHGHCVIFFCYK